MNKEEIGIKLEGVMEAVPVCEGLIYSKLSGEVIIGQTLTEMDHSALAKKAGIILQQELAEANKGSVSDITIGLDDGALICVKKGDLMLIGLLGSDGRSSMGLLRRQIKNIMK